MPGRRWAVAARLVLLAAALLLAGTTPALPASPSPDVEATRAPIIVTGDPRSEGEGPGLMGSPLAVLAGVLALGIVTAALTVVVVRLTRRE
jgi:hypothetical protein